MGVNGRARKRARRPEPSLVLTASAQSGTYALAEAYLYTEEAFRSYLDHLEPNGALAMIDDDPERTVRNAVTAVSVLQRALGRRTDEAMRHVAVFFTTPGRTSRATGTCSWCRRSRSRTRGSAGWPPRRRGDRSPSCGSRGLSRGQEFTVAQGDTRVALHLAQQKIERLSGLGFSAAIIGDRTNGDGVLDGCTVAGTNNEPCYNETFSPGNPTPNGLGLGQQTTGASQLDRQSFTRLTCVRYVQDDNPELPADPLEPPSAWTCPSCVKGAPATCTQSTKRIKVAVFPSLPDLTNTAVDPGRVTLEAVVTPIPRP